MNITINTKKIFKSAVAFILAGGFLLSSVSFIFMARRPQGVHIGTVNGEEITQKELQRSLAQLQQMLKSYPGLEKQFDIKKKALDLVVYEKVLDQAITELGIKLSQDFISECLRDPYFIMTFLGSVIPHYLIDPVRGIKSEELALFLKQVGISAYEFDKIIEKTIKSILFSDSVSSLFYISEDEIKEAYAREHALKKFIISKKSLEPYRLEAKRSVPTERELRALYQEQRSQGIYTVPEKRDVSVWTFDPESYGIVIAPHELEAYKKNHPQESAIEKKIRDQRFRTHFKTDAQKHFASDFDQFVHAKKATLNHRYKLSLAQATGAGFKKAFVLGKHGKEAFVDHKLGIVMRVDEIYPAFTQEFEEVKAIVEQDFYTRKAVAEALEALKKARTNGVLFDKSYYTQEQFSLKPDASREQILKKYAQEGISPATLLSMNVENISCDGATDSFVYSILLSSLEIDPEDYAQKIGAIREALHKELLASVQRGWLIASLARSATLVVYNSSGSPEPFELH